MGIVFISEITGPAIWKKFDLIFYLYLGSEFLSLVSTKKFPISLCVTP
jgi:hypothetical protein